MPSRLKLILFAIVPLIFASACIALIANRQAEKLAKLDVSLFEREILASKRQEIENYMKLAQTSIQHIYANAGADDENAKAEVKRVFHALTYGEDGYFFVYDDKGTNLVHPRLHHIVGTNLWDMKDPNGDHVIRNLIAKAQAGGGFHRYQWNQPSTGQTADKISYAVYLDKWDWMFGTGIYLDDVARKVAEIEAELDRNTRQTVFLIVAVTLVAIIGITGGSLFLNLSERRIADTKLRQLTKRIVEIQEDERQRVARELHDGISQLLVSVKYSLNIAGIRQKQGQSGEESLSHGIEILDEAISEVRRISKDLRPSVLDDLGLAAAVKSLADDFAARVGIDVQVETDRIGDILSSEAKTALYRVMQEALTNIARHAGATKLEVRLGVKGGAVRLLIADNGAGFDARHVEETGDGHGINNMRERLESQGGWLRLRARPGKGASILAVLPATDSDRKEAA
jgi:two-component system NarL family sensor kinase